MSVWQGPPPREALDFLTVQFCHIKHFLPCQRAKLMQINPGNPKRCECNGHKNEGGAGECNGVHPVGCGKWCYVDDDAQCVDTFPSKNSPFRWTCEACLGKSRKPEVYAKYGCGCALTCWHKILDKHNASKGPVEAD